MHLTPVFDGSNALLQMPTTIEELECAIQDTESEANSMLFLNQNVLQEYQNRQHEVQQFYQYTNECKVSYACIVAPSLVVQYLKVSPMSIESSVGFGKLE